MFTGIVEEIGSIKSLSKGGERCVLEVEASFAADMNAGDSVAVSGVCLTIISASARVFTADASPETLKVTTLGLLKKSDQVNIERALELGARIGGHLVYGHVDGVGRLTKLQSVKGAVLMTFEAPVGVAKYVVEKGSITVDGVSLTAFDIKGSTFTVSVIPHTAKVTTLGALKPGDRVNLEADVIGKYVEKLVGGEASEGLTLEKLSEFGYA